ESIDLKEIFSDLKGRSGNKHLLIEGRAGIGKTTLCKFIANAWIDPEKRKSLLSWGKQFEVVIWIKLRELNPKARNLYEAISLLYRLDTKEALDEGVTSSSIPKVDLDVQALLKPL